MDEARSRAMTMATACVTARCRRGKDAGRSGAVGCARLEAVPKSNSRCPWDASRVCTTSASEAKRGFLHAVRYGLRKTLESHRSEGRVMFLYSYAGGAWTTGWAQQAVAKTV